MPPKNFFNSDDESDDDSQTRTRVRPRPRGGDGRIDDGSGLGGNAVAGPSRPSIGATGSGRGARGGRAPPRMANDRRSAGGASRAGDTTTSSSSPSTNANTTFSRFHSADEDGNDTAMTSFMDDSSSLDLRKYGIDPNTSPARGAREVGDGMDDEIDVLDEFAAPGYGEDDNDVKRLMRAWVKERGTVDLMKFEEEVVEDGMNKLEQHSKTIYVLRSDPSTSDEEHFQLMLIATESERVKYLIRGYLRCRVGKASRIEKYSQYIVQTPHMRSLLSDIEWDHACKYTKIVNQHFQSSVLNALPEWLRKMDDVGNDGLSMVRKPDKDVPVLIHCLRDCGEITLSDGEFAQLDSESMHLVSYRLVEKFVNRGWVEVL